jgi:hypothetical protein
VSGLLLLHVGKVLEIVVVGSREKRLFLGLHLWWVGMEDHFHLLDHLFKKHFIYYF